MATIVRTAQQASFLLPAPLGQVAKTVQKIRLVSRENHLVFRVQPGNIGAAQAVEIVLPISFRLQVQSAQLVKVAQSIHLALLEVQHVQRVRQASAGIVSYRNVKIVLLGFFLSKIPSKQLALVVVLIHLVSQGVPPVKHALLGNFGMELIVKNVHLVRLQTLVQLEQCARHVPMIRSVPEAAHNVLNASQVNTGQVQRAVFVRRIPIRWLVISALPVSLARMIGLAPLVNLFALNVLLVSSGMA
jgi:hypothetical protein